MQLNDLAAKVFNLVNGIVSLFWSVPDLNPFLLTGAFTSKFSRYGGPIPFTHLYTRHRILYHILAHTGSQCSSSQHLLGLSNLLAPLTSLAAMF